MCPECSNAFSKTRIDTNHISPRFNSCAEWLAFINGEQFSGIYEVYAGNPGWFWGMEESPCSCGSGHKSMVYFSAKVELYHPEHIIKTNADDGQIIELTCPRQHLGPYDKIPRLDVLDKLIKDLENAKTSNDNLQIE